MESHVAFRRVLIVEDEKVVALDLKRRLTKLGYSVIGTASSADKVLEILKDNMPDVILMDIHIQGDKDGIELAEIINANYAIPIIYLTAYSEQATLDRARSTRPYGYLLKPFSERELHVAIQVSVERFESDEKVRGKAEHLDYAISAAQITTWEINPKTSEVSINNPLKGSSTIQNWNDLRSRIIPRDRSKLITAINTLQRLQDYHVELEFEAEDDDATCKWYRFYGQSIGKTENKQHRIIGVIQDISERHQVEEKLKAAARVFEHTAEGVIILNKERKVESVNDAFSVISGFMDDDLQQQDFPILSLENLGPDLHNEIWQEVADSGYWQGAIHSFRKDNEMAHYWLNISTVLDQKRQIEEYIIIISDISAIHDAQEKLSQIAYFDSLTDLPNRMLLMDRLDQALSKAKREKRKLALLFIDLDNFKRVNDTLGHYFGDKVIRASAQRLKMVLRTTDTLGRLSGDEFVVIQEDIHSPEDCALLCDNLTHALATPLTLDGTELFTTCSIGVSMFPENSVSRDTLLQMADTAMYAAKNRGRNRFSFYSPKMTQQTAHYLTRKNELRSALKNAEFQLFYQPQVDSQSHKLTGMEALIRWAHPKKGMLPAGEVIPVAESSKLIVEIGEWVLNEACRQLRSWQDNGINSVRVAINISIRQLSDGNLPVLIESLLEKYRLDANLLEIEITESCIQDDEICILTLNKLKQLGLTISIDDFGTGYSCMSSLKHLPIHRLKIDRAFVSDIPEQTDDCAIASAIIALGHQLNMKIIAEGLETEAQARFLRDISCDELQGYLFSKPMSAHQATKYLIQNTNGTRKLSS